MASQAPAKGVGCYKCGKTGHWARDCTAPASARINTPGGGASDTPANRAPQPFSRTPVTGENNPDKANPSSQPTLPSPGKKKKKNKRPKLTLDMLKEKKGFPDVFHTFPEVFRKQFRGKGHEVGDLRRLLEMYSRWQHRVFPHGAYDVFVESLEKMSSSHMLKMELRELRQDVMKVLDEPAPDAGWVGLGDADNAEGADTADGVGAAPGHAVTAGAGGQQAEPVAAAAAAAGEEDWPEDDELMEMQNDDDWEMEAAPQELLDAQFAQPANARATAGTATDELPDDDELLALA
ncbi:hypothetical protein WJX72_007585 [[Myrmecia] bisecta]|uniref:CCHC-type domain-containing protein n=1 Tax=[Myrmecia] bisecta TaxID=41462 RepID=A0AAW1PPT4_9CHLO